VQWWKRSDSLFVASLNVELQGAWDEQVARLRALHREALDVISQGLRSDDEKTRLATAWKIRESITAPTGETDATSVQRRWTHESLNSDLAYLF
jgi:hypothetical protein